MINGPRKSVFFRFRWLILLIFPLSFWLTCSKFPDFLFEYFILTLCAAILAAVLLLLLPGDFLKCAPVWIVFLAYILAYFVKYYLIVYVPELLGDGYFSRLSWGVDNPSKWLEVYTVIVQSFASVCLAGALVSILFRGRSVSYSAYLAHQHIVNCSAVRIMNNLSLLVPFLMMITAVVARLYGIGEMGDHQDTAKLPFRLGGAVFYTRLIIIPVLAIFYIWLALSKHYKKHAKLALFLLMIHGVSDMLLRSSKGFIVILIIQLFFLLLLMRKIDRQKIKLFAFFFVFAIPAYTLMASYRSMRLIYPNIGIFDALSLAIDYMPEKTSYNSGDIGMVSRLLFDFIMRLVGADSLALAITMPISQQRFDMSVYFNDTLGGFGVAPSFIGWLYLYGGVPFVWMSGVVLLALMIIWSFLLRSSLLTLPVIQSYFLFWVLLLITEGTLESQGVILLSMVASFMILELIMRRACKIGRQIYQHRGNTQIGIS